MKISDLKITKTGKISLGSADISWSLNLCHNAGTTEELESFTMKEFNVVIDKQKATCLWHGHELLGKNFEVKVIWQIAGDRLSGIISWQGGNGNYIIDKLFFPVVKMPMPYSGDIFISHCQGLLVKNIENKKLRPDGNLAERVNPMMQFTALLGNDKSYYFDSQDTDFYLKGHEYRALDDFKKVCYKGIHFLPLDGKSSRRYKIPYPSGITSFKGGWFDASQIYKKWARNQKWAKRPPVDKRLRDIGMWVWNRGYSEDVITPVEKLQNDSGVPMALDWYWWHKNGYDTSYPDYWPPREGVSAFKKVLSRLNKQNIFTQVYMNGVTWDMDAEHWKNGGSDSVVINRDGTEMATMFNTFAKRRLAWMCGNDNLPFRKRIRETIRKLKNAGLSGIYLDMIGCASDNPCYNKKHNHVPGGGNYQVAGYRKMAKAIIAENPGFPLSTEEANEAYIDLFDSAISLSGGIERMLTDPALHEPVPAFSAVYHGLNAMFGNYALPDSIPPFDPKWPGNSAWKKEKQWHKLYSDQFFVEISRSVIWGLQPTVANIKKAHCQDPEFREIYDYLVKTARFYHANRDFLFDGEMQDYGILKTDEIEVDFLARFIFTKEGEQKVYRKKMPAVLHSLWKAPDGRLGLVLANYSQKKQNFKFNSDFMSTAGEISSRSWMIIEKI